ncbi:MAG: helix-turn-helix domain-containing protein [Crocinitomicaceae bacterium]
MFTPISIIVPEITYLKNPDSSDLGKKIISGAIELIDQLGFEVFTFKKLGIQIGSTEASIYRYFESKHQILVYLTSWYWSWVDYNLILQTINIPSPTNRLINALKVVTKKVEYDSTFSYVDEIKLHSIVSVESSKIYMNKHVDQDNSIGYFIPYKNVVQRVSQIILEINPAYNYPHMLISTTIEGAHLQRFFAEHLPRLTDVIPGEDSVTEFYTNMVFKAIEEK